MSSIDNNNQINSTNLIFEAKIAGTVPALIRGIVRRQIVDRHVKEVKIEPTPAELQAAADRFRLNNNLATIEVTEQWLNANLLTLDDFEYIITQNLLAERLAQHLFADRVPEFFYQNSLDYCNATLYEVILEDRNLAMELFYSLQEGDLSFADVAHQYIPDPELRRRGGYIGKIDRKQLRPEISAAVFAAKPPQLIKPIVTAVGVHLIQVEEIVQPQLDERLHQQILTEIFENWLNETTAAVMPTLSIEL
jgi:parvulin-like peptidyl-prolyl isomerase